MTKLGKLFQFYIYSNLHVALCTWALTRVTGYFFQIDIYYTSLFIGAATFISYNGIRFLKIQLKYNRAEVSKWFIRQKNILMSLSCIAFLVLGYAAYNITIEAFVVGLPFFVLTLFYMVSFWKTKLQKLSFRNLPGFKIFSISISWAGLCVLFPIIAAQGDLDIKAFWFFIEQFLFVLVLTIPFDIRDMDYDSKDLKTLPQILGLGNVKILGGFLLVLALSIHYSVLFENSNISFLAITVLLFLLLIKSKRCQTKYYASFWVESIPLVYFLLVSNMS